jgi:hypothetical protein
MYFYNNIRKIVIFFIFTKILNTLARSGYWYEEVGKRKDWLFIYRIIELGTIGKRCGKMKKFGQIAFFCEEKKRDST